MNELDRYLAHHFLQAEQLVMRCGITCDELFRLIDEQLIPAPSYVVSELSALSSFAFGSMEAKGSTNGQYFHPSNTVWVKRAIDFIAQFGRAHAAAKLKYQFSTNLQIALADYDRTVWRLKDAYTDTGLIIEGGLTKRADSFWLHFLKGTFGLCVANPVSERAIVHKEILQEKLVALTQNGKKERYSGKEASEILALMDEFAEAAMPFSPIEYSRSSRKTLIDDVRLHITKVKENAN
jgi:hypothetical protein